MRYNVEIYGRVWGPPGTGKTTRLVRDARALIQQGKKVLALTYTTSAADEMRERLGLAHDFVRGWGTIHSAALRSLPSDISADFRHPQFTFYNFARAWRLPYDPSDPFSPKLGNRIQVAYEMAVGKYYVDVGDDVKAIRAAMGHGEVRPDHAWYAAEYARWKREQREDGKPAYDFTDMLIEALKWGEPWEDYDFVLIDEAQDVSPLEWAVITRLYDPSTVILYGDPAQNIYENLTGADSDIFLKAQPAEVDEVLPRTYRLPPQIWQVALKYVRLAGLYDPRLESVQTADRQGTVIASRPRIKDALAFASKGYTVAVLCRTNRGALHIFREFVGHGVIPRAWKRSSKYKILDYLWDVEQWLQDKPHNAKAVKAFLEHLDEQDLTVIKSPLYPPEYKIKYIHTTVLPKVLGLRIRASEVRVELNVVVDTIHAAKGREADVVFVDTTDYRGVFTPFEARVRYVGVTRARKMLFVWGR